MFLPSPNDWTAFLAIDIEHCYRRFRGLVFRRCRGLLRDDALAEDVMHDVFVKLCTYEEVLDDRALSSLLYRIATRESLNAIRARRIRVHAPLDPMLERIAGFGDEAERTVARQLLHRLFPQEEESSRVIAVLHLHDGFTLEQVADHTGMSLSGVRRRLRVISQQLKTLMEEQP